MKKILTTLPLILIATLFTNCSDKNSTVQPTVNFVSNTLPEWYTQAPQNSTLYLYGIGRGESRKHAIGEALNDAVSTLNVSVSSSFSNRTDVSSRNGSENVSSSANSDLNVLVKEMELNNYKLLQHQTYGREELVLIQINKQKLYNKLYNDIELSFEMYDTRMQEKQEDLEKIVIYRHYLNRLRGQLGIESLLTSLNPTYDDDEAFKTRFKKIFSNYNALIDAKRFKLALDDPTGDYTDTIKQSLLQDGLKLTSNSAYDYIVEVTIKEVEDIVVRREVISNLSTTITITLSTKMGEKSVHSTSFSIKSSSDVSIEKARDANNKTLYQLALTNDIFSIPSN